MAKLYCSVDDVKELTPIIYQDLGFDSEDNYNKFLNRTILKASRRIDRFCNRPNDFFNGGATITEYFDGKPSRSSFMYPDTERTEIYLLDRRTYWLTHTPVLSVTSVQKNTASIGETDNWVDITKYRLNTETGRLVIASTVAPPEGVQNVKVVYVAGYTSVPDEVRMACEELVSNYVKTLVQQGLEAKIRFTRPVPITFSQPLVFTDGIKELLEPYKKRRM